MYSGTTLHNKSGAIIGTHQKIDRVAHANLLKLTDTDLAFPNVSDILHFEGKNGPDGIKRKSPAKDEPWHFYDPFDEDDTQLLAIIEQHYSELVKQLKKSSPERAAFDAAWLSHALVDGLTPAHHYPYEEKLLELRGEGVGERDSLKNKLIIQGDTMRDSMKKNWAMWGFGGLMSMHGMFEMGVAVLLAPVKLQRSLPNEHDLDVLLDVGYLEVFKRAAREIALLDMYERFHARGWTVRLARDVRNHLGPIIAKTVCIVWYSAARDAGLLRGKK